MLPCGPSAPERDKERGGVLHWSAGPRKKSGPRGKVGRAQGNQGEGKKPGLQAISREAFSSLFFLISFSVYFSKTLFK